MKRLLTMLCVVFLCLSAVQAGELQKHFEQQNPFPINQKPAYLLADDYKSFNSNIKSLYGVICAQLEDLPQNTADYKYISQIKQNYDNFMDINAWRYIDVPDSIYKNLLDSTKFLLIFNNSIYYNK